jgi:signal transduction histidine kinase
VRRLESVYAGSRRVELRRAREAPYRVRPERSPEGGDRHIVASVGHDLRTPVTVVSIAAHLLPRLGALNPAQSKVVAQIAASVRRIDTISRDLLAYAQIREGGGMPLTIQPSRMDEICRRVVRELAVVRPGRTIRVAVENGAAGEWDPDRLEQVVSNVVGNAIQHGDPAAAVELRARRRGEDVVLDVHNRGDPIPPPLLPFVFEPFRHGGRPAAVGLGLYIAREIVQAHGGTIEIRSTQSEGTTVTVTLPRRRRAAK